MGKNWKMYTEEDVAKMVELRKLGKTHREIAKIMGRDAKSISMKFYQMRREEMLKDLDEKRGEMEQRSVVSPAANGPQAGRPTSQMSPREMIKKLYDMGYRIENNQLVCYVKKTVNINDVLHGDN